MKNILYSFGGIMLGAALALGFAACSPEEFDSPKEAGIPEAIDYEDAVRIEVDQETNYAYFYFDSQRGVMPVWIIDGKNYSSNFTISKYYRKAGDYAVEVKIANANGVSDGSISKTFHVDKTKMSGFPGFVYESPFNLWTKATKKINSFWYAPGWNQIADPVCSFDGDVFSLTLPEATTDQWQAQMHVGTDISLPEGEHYDGSVIFTSTTDLENVTMKIHPDGDDDDAHSFFCNQKINLTAGEPAAFFFSDLEAAVDMNNLVYTFDFGGNPAGCEITIENIIIKKHSDDDGTVLPELPKEQEPNWVDVDSEENLFSNFTFTNSFWYAPGWTQIADPTITDNGDGSYTVSLPTAASERWQAQVAFNTNLEITDPSVVYDFTCTMESNVDIPAVMFKLVETDESEEVKHDNNYFFADEMPVNSGVNKFWRSKLTPKEGTAMHAVTLIFDFGTCPGDTEVKISNIILQKHKD